MPGVTSISWVGETLCRRNVGPLQRGFGFVEVRGGHVREARGGKADVFVVVPFNSTVPKARLATRTEWLRPQWRSHGRRLQPTGLRLSSRRGAFADSPLQSRRLPQSGRCATARITLSAGISSFLPDYSQQATLMAAKGLDLPIETHTSMPSALASSNSSGTGELWEAFHHHDLGSLSPCLSGGVQPGSTRAHDDDPVSQGSGLPPTAKSCK